VTGSARLRIVAADPSHHRIGIAERHHAGGEMVPILVDQALDVALEKAVALEPLVEKGGIGCVTLRKPGVDDLDPAAQLDPQGARALAHAVLPPDEQRRPKSLLDEARRGADDLFLFAFSEHDPLPAS